MTETAKTAAPATAPKAEAKPKAPPKPPKFNPDAKITLLTDKEGKKYGVDNNPKRANSKSAVWFANYKDGMTVRQLAEAYQKTGGSMNANLAWDIEHGFISVEGVEGPKPKAPAEVKKQ